MSNTSSQHAQLRCSTARSFGCDTSGAGLILLALMHTTGALASDQASISGSAMLPNFISKQPTFVCAPMPSQSVLDQAGNFPEAEADSAREFRPRGRSLSNQGSHADARDDTSAMHSTVWHQLSEYRSHDGVRLFTFWQAGASNLSLQADKKGDPSLQWTSRFLNRGATTSGLLNDLFSTSIDRGAGRGLHFAPHTTTAGTPVKPLKLMDAGNAGSGTR